MLIIPKHVLFEHATVNMYNLEVTFLIIKWEEFPVLIDLIGLITSTDFNRLSIKLNLVINQFQNLSQFPALIIITTTSGGQYQ